MRKCLIVDEMHPSIVEMLSDTGLHVDYIPDISKEKVLEVIPEYFGLIVRSKLVIDKKFLDQAQNLAFIGRAGAGMDQIDVQECETRKISLFNAPEGNRDAVAEHTLGMILCLLNKIAVGDRQIRAGIWNREANRGYELAGKIVSVIGYGYMGKAVAKKLQLLNCEVLIFDKHKNGFNDGFGKETNLEEIFERSDIVTLHIPLNTENKWWCDYEFLNSFRKNYWIVNTARGEILKTDALIRLINDGKIRGAALDVLENEKLDKLTDAQKQNLDFLVNSDKVLLTPHIAGWTYESLIKINEVLVEKIKKSGLIH